MNARASSAGWQGRVANTFTLQGNALLHENIHAELGVDDSRSAE